MTNQEVINFLNQVRKILLDDKSWLESTIQPINEAFDIAISAVRAQDVPDTNVGDMVSRRAAIDALGTITIYKGNIPYDTAVMKIEKLPSPQPEIIRCKDCKYFELDRFEKVKGLQNPLIVAHEVCTKWGNGCQSSVDGWCFIR